MYDRILLPTDGSECASLALTHAIDLATRYDAELHALYVVSSAHAEAGPIHAATMASLVSYGEETLEYVRERLASADVSGVMVLRHGKPHRTIVEYAEETEVDLLVMGTHGRTGLERYLLGSVTEKVVRTSNAPVLTVRQSDA